MIRNTETLEVRDNRGGEWLWMHNTIIDHYGPLIGAYGVAVYAALSRYANREGQAWPSIQTLAAQLAIAPNTVRRTLATLEQHSLLSVTRRRTERDLNLSSIYTLVNPNTNSSTSPGEVLPQMKEGTSPGEGGVLRQVKEGTSPRAPKQDSYNKTQNNKTQRTRGGASIDAPIPAETVEPVVKPSRKREPKTTEEERAYYAETVPALAEACRLDLGIDGVWAQCQKQLRALYNAQVRPTAALIVREYGQPGGYWYAHDWRGQKGEAPTPHFVTNTWGAATAYRDKPNGHARAATGRNGQSQYDRNMAILYSDESSDDMPLPPIIEGRVRYGHQD